MKLFEMFKKSAPELEDACACPIEMPESYTQLDPLPSDPDDLSIFVMQERNSLAIANVKPLRPCDYRMPFGDPQSIIDGIHEDHDDDQGLIEVNAFATALGYRGIYSIVKTVLGLKAEDEAAELEDDDLASGVQYGLLLHMDTENGPVSVHAFFEEVGLTGLREAAVFEAMRQAGRVGPCGEGWNRDPYEPTHTRGIAMNLSEYRDFDPAFPEHPLTLCRELVAYLIATN